MCFIGEPGKATHKDGHVIDLPFSNIPFAESRIDEDCMTGWDHYPQRIYLPDRGQSSAMEQNGWRVNEDALERLAEIVAAKVHTLPELGPNSSNEDVELAAEGLVSLIMDAVKVVGTKKRVTGKSAPWWTEECGQS
ncbi:hypothetical protein HD806DRAFT_410813 [Xylariaceae sp. AK1471]|nr:hypothetical protein HD806DRAFT_410813 [Xylariaceae sp. AK1471]